jgi:cold shock CspA family protein
MRFDGTIKSWNDERGFGFIEPNQGGQQIFVHIKAFKGLRQHPQPNQRVSFQVEVGPQGKKRAINAELLRGKRAPQPTTRKIVLRSGAQRHCLPSLPLACFCSWGMSWGIPLVGYHGHT